MGQLSVVGSVLFYIGTFGISGIVSKAKIPKKIVKFFLMIIPPVALAMFRYNIGYDYGSYILAYKNSFDLSYQSIIMGYKSGDPIAYYLVTKIATVFNSERVFLMILAILAITPGIVYIIRDWGDLHTQPMMVFFFLFSPFIFSFSACKQGIALSILMFSLKYIYDRKPIKFVVCVVIACLFHSTAIVFLLVYFFLNSKGNLSTMKKIIIIMASILVIINLQSILGHVMNGRYGDYAISIVEGKNRTFWLYSVMTFFFIIFRKRMVENDKRNELLIMMMVVGTLCQYLGFSNAFAKRIGEYFLMAQVFLIPQSVYLFTKESRKLANLLIFIYIVAIFLIANPIASSGMGFVPYQYKFW